MSNYESLIVNMSVWQDVNALRDFVYKSAHVEILRRKREWFTHMADAYLVLWWVPRGHEPTVAEAVAKLSLLRERGPAREAFSFAEVYSAPDAQSAGAPFSIKDGCPA